MCVDHCVSAAALSDSDCPRKVKQKAVLFWGRWGIQSLSLTLQQWHWETIKYWEDVCWTDR